MFSKIIQVPPYRNTCNFDKTCFSNKGYLSIILELIFKKKRKKDQKENLITKTSKEKNENATNSFSPENGKQNKKQNSVNGEEKKNFEHVSLENNTSINRTISSQQQHKTQKSENTINNETENNKELVNRLEMIFIKYKNIFEPDDLADFETIIDTLKSNLND